MSTVQYRRLIGLTVRYCTVLLYFNLNLNMEGYYSMIYVFPGKE